MEIIGIVIMILCVIINIILSVYIKIETFQIKMGLNSLNKIIKDKKNGTRNSKSEN